MNKTYANIAEALAKKEKKYTEAADSGNSRVRNSAKLMLEEIKKRKEALVAENNMVSSKGSNSFADGGSVGGDNPYHKRYQKKLKSVGIDRVDKMYADMVQKAEEYLQELYPGKTVKVQASDGIRGLDRQRAAVQKGSSNTPVSLHQFGGARDFNIIVDGKKILNENTPLYEKTIWKAAEDVGLQHLDPDGMGSWDPYHVGLVKETGDGTAFDRLFTDYPELLDLESSQEHLDGFRKIADQDPKFKNVVDSADRILAQRQAEPDANTATSTPTDVVRDATTPPPAQSQREPENQNYPLNPFPNKSWLSQGYNFVGNELDKLHNLPETALLKMTGTDNVEDAMGVINYGPDWERIKKMSPEERQESSKRMRESVGKGLKGAARGTMKEPGVDKQGVVIGKDMFDGARAYTPRPSQDNSFVGPKKPIGIDDVLGNPNKVPEPIWDEPGFGEPRDFGIPQGSLGPDTPMEAKPGMVTPSSKGKAALPTNLGTPNIRKNKEVSPFGQESGFEKAMRYGAPFIDNIAAQAGINRLEAPPAPTMEAPINMDNEYNIDAALGANADSVNNIIQGAMRTSGNSGQIGALRGNMAAAKIRGNNQLYSQKYNAETQSRNRETAMNAQIGARNTNRLNTWQQYLNQFKNQKTQYTAQNIGNLGQDIQDTMAAEQRRKFEEDTARLYANALNVRFPQ